MLATGSLSEVSVDAMEGDGSVLARPPKFPSTNWMMSCLFRDRQHFNTVQDPRLAVTLPLLHRRCQTFHATPSISCWYANEKKKVALEFKSILQSPSSQLFRQVMVTLLDADSKRGACTEATLSGRVDYDGQLNTTSMAQEIEALQVKLDAATDEGEQRALEEDVTGKILWLCWCGICAEADDLLPKVVDYVRREGDTNGILAMCSAMRSIVYADPGDDRAHLRRIMHDAGAGTSKYQLLLAARAVEEARWSNTNRGTTTIDYPWY
ncbi:hypothetical protein EDD16DRAFT_983551 [Pisolithus croceorrhizus]|nr:hypothetical protein EDD16DRAFT_983551 [Pisolithus croceorrhizus]